MKIYPCNHDINKVENLDVRKHIPLSYIGSPKNNKIKVSLNLLNEYKKEYVKTLKAYDVIDNFKTIIFNENGDIIDNNIYLKEAGNNKYYYMPTYTKTEKPIEIGYRILYQSRRTYSKLNKYNIKVGLVDNSKNAESSKALASIFGNSNLRGLSASNVIVNNGDISPSALINRKLEENDMVFIETEDGEHYKGTDVKIDYDFFQKNSINIWLIAGKLFKSHYGKIELSNDSVTDIKTNIAFNNTIYESDFVISETNNKLKEISGDRALVLTHNLNQNYVITTGEDFFINLNKNAKAIHEILLYTYLNRYIVSEQKVSWIHDYVPDYKFNNGKLVKIDDFYEDIELIKEFTPLKVVSGSKLVDTDIKNDKVYFYFKDKENFIDNKNNITILDHNKNIITIDQSIKHSIINLPTRILKYTVKDDKLLIKFAPFINSLKEINIQSEYVYEEAINVNKINTKKLFYNIDNNVIELLEEPIDGKFIGVVNIEIYNEDKLEAYDLRPNGGGTIDDIKDYNLLDIGSSYGRPLRKSGSMIIELPKRLEKYEDKIRQHLDQHKIADRHYILIFKERG